MSADFTIGQGADEPSILYAVTPTDIDLTGATVAFSMSIRGALVIDEAAGTVESVTPPVLRYDWQAGDTDDFGSGTGQFTVTYAGGGLTVFPAFTIEITRAVSDLPADPATPLTTVTIDPLAIIGTPLPGAVAQIEARGGRVAFGTTDALAVDFAPVAVALDNSGVGSVDLVPGNYVCRFVSAAGTRVRTLDFTVDETTGATARLVDLIDGPGYTPAPYSAALAATQAAQADAGTSATAAAASATAAATSETNAEAARVAAAGSASAAAGSAAASAGSADAAETSAAAAGTSATAAAGSAAAAGTSAAAAAGSASAAAGSAAAAGASATSAVGSASAAAGSAAAAGASATAAAGSATSAGASATAAAGSASAAEAAAETLATLRVALPIYADESAAQAGGLIGGQLYRTADGAVRVVLDPSLFAAPLAARSAYAPGTSIVAEPVLFASPLAARSRYLADVPLT